MEKLLIFIASIPDTVWAALLASGITLGGVFLTNRHSAKQHDKQLSYDSTQRRDDRDMSLKRGVYLDAVESLARSYSAIPRLCNLDLDGELLANEIGGNPGAVAKMQIVANNKTVQAVSELSLRLGEISLDLLIHRARLIDRKNQIEMLSKFLAKAETSQENTVELMKNLNLQGNVDKRLWAQVDRNFEHDRGQAEKYSTERNELWTGQNQEHAKFFELCISRLTEVSSLVPPAILAIREELEMPIDSDLFIKNHSIYSEKSRKIISDFIDSAKEVMNA